MKIGIYCNWALYFYSNKYYIDSVDYKYLECLHARSSEIFLLSTVVYGVPPNHYKAMDINNVRIIDIPYFSSYLGALRYIRYIFKGLFFVLNSSDFVYIRAPEPFSWLVLFLKNQKQYINFHFASNPFEVLLNNKRVFFIKRWAKAIVFFPEFILISVASFFNNCSCNGRSVIKNIPFFLRKRVKVAYESTLNKSDFIFRRPMSILDNDTIRFLVVSRLHDGKGLFELLDAFFIISKKIPDKFYCLDIVGDGILDKSLKEYLYHHGLHNNIKFHGAVENGPALQKIYDRSDVFIMPSLSETGPRVLIEAMFSSCLCISTDVGYVRELLDETSGIIVPPGNVHSLVSAVDWVFDNRKLAKEMAKKSFSNSQGYTIESFFDKVLKQH